MKKLLTFLLIIFLSFNLSAQKETYLSIKSNIHITEFYSFEDKGPLIKNAIYQQFDLRPIELNVGRELFSNFILEIGIKLKNYKIGYHSNVDDKHRFYTYLFTTQIPFRLKYKYSLNNRFSLRPYFGCIFGIDRGPDDKYYLYPKTAVEKNYFLNRIFETSFKENFFLVNIGMDTEFRIAKRHSLVLNIGFAKGFDKLVSERVEYATHDDIPFGDYSSLIIGKGDYLAIGLSYKYNFIAKPIKYTNPE